MNWITNLLQSFSKPLQWWVTVAAWEQGVLVRLGKHTHHLMPGVHFRIPFLDRCSRVCVRSRIVDTDRMTVSTRDGKALTIGFSIQYAIVDAKKMIEGVARPESTIKSLVHAHAADIVSRTQSDVLHPKDLQDEITGMLDLGRWGIGDVSVYVVTFAYSRVFRILNGHDHGYGSSLDGALDEHPAVTS